jgi:hypothetical protein
MKKTILTVLVVIVFLAAAAFADAAVIKIKVTTANVRQQPDATSAVISRAALGTLFEVIKKIGNWFEVAVTDATGKTVTGFINADVVEEVGAPGAPAQPQRTAPAYAAPRAGSGASAGTKPAGGLFIGAGLLMSNMAFDSDTQSSLDQYGYKKKMKMGFQFGVGYEMPLSPNISIMPGLFYSTAGASLDYAADNAYSFSYSFSGVMIPIDVKISFNGPFVTVGPYIGYFLSGKAVPAEGESEDLFKADADGNVYYNRLHFGLSLGAGIDLDLGGMVLMIKAGYQLGLSNLYKPVDSTDKSSMKHNAITILAAIKL